MVAFVTPGREKRGVGTKATTQRGKDTVAVGGGIPIVEGLLDLLVVLIAARSVRDLNFAAEDKPEDDSWGLCEIPDVLGRTCGFSANYKAHRLL